MDSFSTKRSFLITLLSLAIVTPIGIVAFGDFKSCLTIDRFDEQQSTADLPVTATDLFIKNRKHAARIRSQLENYKREYTCRFKRNQYAQNTIISISILLSILIVVAGSSPWFKDPKNQSVASPLGISMAAWLGLIATALLSLQKSYNVSSKMSFYPTYILRVSELIDRLDYVPYQKYTPEQAIAELNAIQRDFFKVRQDEIKDRPSEVSPIAPQPNNAK